MNNDILERKKVIQELQKLAEEVLALKAEHRQKRPIVIEFSGSPKAGKTSCINSLELFLKRNGFSVHIIQERASVCPVCDKQSPMFNLWTSCSALAGLIGILESKKNQVDVLILDRGIFDGLCWFEWLIATDKMDQKQKEIAEQFLLMEEFVKSIDIVFAFCVEPDISIAREYATLLTDKPGTIMNKKVLSEYLEAIEHTIQTKEKYFHKVFKIDTANKTQDEVGKEITSRTLNTLKTLLMERIGYFEKNPDLENILSTKTYFEYNELCNHLPQMMFDVRDQVEGNSSLLQPIPIAIITNKAKDKIFVIKKNRDAVSIDSPEKDKLLIYVGGHSRFEDQTQATSDDFLSICKTTLRREIKEEIGISIALNNSEPFFIYSTAEPKSRQHLAICFTTSIDEDSTKLHLDPQELVQKRGKSKSGKFLSLDEIEQHNLEEWSRNILKHCFHVNSKQISIFDLQP